jgi:hypothetical protein
MLITDAIRTKFVGGTKYITYTENGVTGVDSLSWSFEWIAPEAKEVVFYGGFNSNFDGHKGGDQTFLSTLKVKRNASTGINETPEKQTVRIYPNPTYDYVLLDFEVKVTGDVLAEIIDMNGKQISLLMDGELNSGKFQKKFDISLLADGQYLVRVNVNGTISSQKIQISR